MLRDPVAHASHYKLTLTIPDSTVSTYSALFMDNCLRYEYTDSSTHMSEHNGSYYHHSEAS